MEFPESLKLSVKRRAHFRCCLCHALGVEIHHIIPQSEEGSDNSEDNAAPLCPSCHETYGMNPTKRKFIREARELWFDICAKRYASDPDRLDELGELLKNAVTKSDLDGAVEKLVGLVREAAERPGTTVKQRATEVSSLGGMIGSGIGIHRVCENCGTSVGLYVGDPGSCPSCGEPW